jgi:tRNA A-37 threonylcarbamoyl transferase component Bud32
VNGKTVEGWTIRAPLPISVSTSPLALVMTMTPGMQIESLLRSSDASPEILGSAARAVVKVMRLYWANGCLHGDLSFRNILFDPTHRVLSLIDVDPTAGARDRVPSEWYPASLDLAGVVYDVATDIRAVDRRVMSGKRMFAESVLLAYLATLRSADEKRRLVEEVRACARAELNALDLSWSPSGLYHRLQRRVATQRIDRLLESVPVGGHPQRGLAAVGGEA